MHANNKIKLIFNIAVILVIFTASSANAFHFRFLGFKDPVHDSMSESALRCVIESEADEFKNCEEFKPATNSRKLTFDVNGFTEIDTDDIILAARWPDDPVRELRGHKLLKMPVWLAHMTTRHCKGLKDGLKDGLRCSSHYGPAQFLHSMEFKVGQDAEITRGAILDWAEYSYRIAVNDQKDGEYFLENEYCEYFKRLDESYFKSVMYPNNGEDFPCNEDDDTPWLVGTPYSFSCSVGVSNCTSYTGVNDLRVRVAALGAILHAIQDSYAKGHTSRSNDSAIHQYECAKIHRFQVYDKQDDEKHALADKMPSPAKECLVSSMNKGSIHGPITASAQIIRMFKNKIPASKVRDYLGEYVFVVDKAALKADSTEYFKK